MDSIRDIRYGGDANSSRSGTREPADGHVFNSEPTTLDEESTIKALTENVRDQDDIERDISRKAELALIESEDRRDEKRIEKLEATRTKLEEQKGICRQRLAGTALENVALKSRLEREISQIIKEVESTDKDLADFRRRISQRHLNQEDISHSEVTNCGKGKNAGSQRLPNETQREYLIRTGKITPFSKIGGTRSEGVEGDLADVIQDAEDEAAAEGLVGQAYIDEPTSHQNLRLPGFSEGGRTTPDAQISGAEAEFSLRPRKKRKTRPEAEIDDAKKDEEEWLPTVNTGSSPPSASDDDDFATESDLTSQTRPISRKKKARTSKVGEGFDETSDINGVDDGNEAMYKRRLEDWVGRREAARKRRKDTEDLSVESEDEEEWFKPSPDGPDHIFENGLKLPGDIYPSLFGYQKTAVRWLAELYDIKVGGIIGDEMGLGKTVQLISFVAALHYSKRLDKPVIVVAPATVLRQWVNEFHRWWPPLRVSILHSSGSGMLNVHSEDLIEKDEISWGGSPLKRGSNVAAKAIVDRVVQHGHVLVTTYAGLQTYGDILIPVDWGYAVLDEGHKIRNPNTALTVYCKELRTPNRIILSGTPIQNNLTELWSLFDFIYPMRLGTLVTFRNQFEIPIRLGGYANATNLQIMTAQKCAETLKDAISPYLLQRTKADVATDLPKKSEQVLFCKLTESQRQAYELFLRSDEMSAILNRARQSLYGIDILRKICNHPDLAEPQLKHKEGYNWGSPSKSGKMQVVKALLQMWKRFGHKTLLFCQGTQMLDILEIFTQSLGDIQYLRMDGKTPIKDRQTLVDRFNNDPQLNVFLLTTKVGGLGVNLTGADRVIIFDPDWNPSTDVQARERAWRLGQKRQVTIYRLMTAGTIEEKIYHRQIFKQFLTNKVLKDPKQRASFGLHDLHDLFSLGSYEDGVTETSELFRGNEVHITPSGTRRMITPGPGAVPIVTIGKSTPQSLDPIRTARTGNSDEEEGNLHSIAGVAGVEEYKQEGKAEAEPTSEEDQLMKGIFSQAAIHSALEHDQIMSGGGKKVQADRRILEQEANRVASVAATHLRQAGEDARLVPIGTVTWTGEVGDGGRPRNIRRGRTGPSSTGILAGIADRQGLQGSPGSRGSSRSATPDRRSNKLASDFEKMIPNFIRRHGGKVPSKLLVDHFNQYCIGKEQASEFKIALDKVAKMEKAGSSMRAIWSLQPRYR
ncbi:DNA repair protein rhp26 [Grosmannia clavigera kw1407]|uniref:DNA repair protein rhp26 n=1 Tax=Grosmannia clavigera (strain kw1407 / UAMH 11150) TaxID=655863 RepID=F0XR10_GROCL|nr:DNA repair protein rhp26 [Grosmannia clavigera kw1407]EFW99946.1 DNA repair protein rhp26 [Grosmannia clavigera kw1407]